MEPSLFDPREQQASTDARIVYALERVSEAFRVLLWRETKSTGLSPIQAQILIFLLYHGDEKKRVSYLAQEFHMTKATISEVVKTLMNKKLVRKQVDTKDSRSSVILLTIRGEEVAREVASFASVLRGPLNSMQDGHKETLLRSMVHLLGGLQDSGVIGVQRMCIGCRHFEKRDDDKHFCQALTKSMSGAELRLDCDEHQPLKAVVQ